MRARHALALSIALLAVVTFPLEAASAPDLPAATASLTPTPTPTPVPTPTPIAQCHRRKLKAQGSHAMCQTQALHAFLKRHFDPDRRDAATAACEQRLTEVYASAEGNMTAYCRETGDAPLAIELGRTFAALVDRVSAYGWQEVRSVDGGSIVTDHATGLDWEVKTTAVGSGENADDPHDVDNVYTWSTGGPPYLPDGTVFTDFLARLNGAIDGVCFAGHCDWRLPTREELETIVDAEGACAGSCIAPIFGPTRSYGYWSSTTDAVDPQIVWIGNFGNGGVISMFYKTNAFSVRAVRGGSPL